MGQTTNTQYLYTFKNKVSVIESYVGDIRNDLELSKEELAGSANPPDTDKQAATKASKINTLEWQCCAEPTEEYTTIW